VNRGRPGSKLHLLTDGAGVPLAVALSAANVADLDALVPLVQAIPAVRSQRGPRRRRPDKLHADKAYDAAWARAWLRGRRIVPRIARRGVQTSTRLGRHRWRIERSFAWLGGRRRLLIRYERKPANYLAFATLACALIAIKHLHPLKY
jgi:transposase